MTFEELLELDPFKIESLSDNDLKEILSPLLKNVPPIDLKVYLDAKESEKALKDSMKKLKSKVKKKSSLKDQINALDAMLDEI